MRTQRILLKRWTRCACRGDGDGRSNAAARLLPTRATTATRHHICPTIAQRNMHRKPKPGLPRVFDRPQYRQRNVIERCFSWLKEKRRLCTRYDKLAISYNAMVTLACIEWCLRAGISDRPLGSV